MMDWNPRCYIPSSLDIGLPVPEYKIIEGFFTIHGPGGHLGHLTSIISSDFHFLVPESFHKNLVQIGKVVTEKIRLQNVGIPMGTNCAPLVADLFLFCYERDVPHKRKSV